MTNKPLISLLSSAFILGLHSCNQSEDRIKPNIIFILADDLGYGELSCFGQEIIQTPNIDALAERGIVFTQHYSGSAVCAPSRCALLTGMHPGHMYIRGNDEWDSRGDVWNYEAVFYDENLEGQRPLPANTTTIASILKSAGYKTSMIGKWGLGAPNSESVPTKLGFDHFFGYNCQRQAHTYFPTHLWRNEEKIILNNRIVSPGTKLVEGADPNDPSSYADYQLNDYAPELMLNEAKSFINEHQADPFFLYYASPIPHVPLQAPAEWVEKYKNLLGDEAPYLGEKGYFPNQFPKATYAAMISYLDFQVGELVKSLKQNGIYENTLIIFTSDNGPTYAGGVDPEYFNSAKPFSSFYRRGKGFLYEGGIRVPLIVSWPEMIKQPAQSDHISAFWDVLPTLCEISGAQVPENVDGISFLPSMLHQVAQKEHQYLYWEIPEYGGQQALRMGKWKAVRKDIHKGNLEIELYDLSADINEKFNLADKYPEIINQIENIFLSEHLPSKIDRFKFEALGDKY